MAVSSLPTSQTISARWLRRPRSRLRVLSAALHVTGAVSLWGCADEEAVPAACYQLGAERAELSSEELCALLPDACPAVSGALPAQSEAVTVVPDAAAMPAGVASQLAHNNLDIAWHGGRLFFAFRTAPSHFAHEEVMLYVVSTTDQQKWVLEASYALGKDLREPRFLSVGGKLFLYFARLSEITFTFQPEATMVSEQVAGCQWTAPVDIDIARQVTPEVEDTSGFIPWRARTIDGTHYLIGYLGGENVVELGAGGLAIYWLKTNDGRNFEPVVAGQPVVLTGGSSETDFAFLDDGAVVAVSRNESGDELGFGSKICRAEAGALGEWSCAADPKKYDSPLVFRHGQDVYLIGRRQVANDGKFDLGRDDLPPEDRAAAYQTAYWTTPKRCALWRVDPDALSVAHVMDLPSNGDTCFASVVPLSDDQYLVYNYTSPLDDPELPWNHAQVGPTSIYRLTLTLP